MFILGCIRRACRSMVGSIICPKWNNKLSNDTFNSKYIRVQRHKHDKTITFILILFLTLGNVKYNH